MSRKNKKVSVKEMPIRKLNKLHLGIYYFVTTGLVVLIMPIVLAYVSTWVGYFLLFLALLLYGMGPFPIVRGTRKKDVDGGLYDFISRLLLYMSAAAVITCIVIFSQWMGGK